MADFLSNLLIRSAADPLTSAMLQPRLPALFELLQSPSEIQMPSSDPLPSEIFAQTRVQTATEIPQSKLLDSPSTIRVEHTVSPMLGEADHGIPAQDELPSAKRETQPSAIPQPQVKKLVKRFGEPEERIIPDHGQDHSFVDPPSVIQENPFHLPEEGNKTLRAESVPAHVQTEEESVLPKHPIKSSIEISIRPTEEDYVAEDESSTVGYFPLKTNLNSATQLQPILPVSRPVGQNKKREPQNVVEIHIGRVEVRAIAAPAAQPSKPRAAAIMTLDEYLQRRKAGDR
jgi:hypothetical protein